ncbi:glycoside hydrolase family 15 protein [Actinokineospora xionganensis]|uniref:Glycoside hydrolase family 15 protein n=1 Tax=Actinokineospora xionganensis TaxID=2684470 RepID=A0ABR7L8E4_9PSEU|nr:glycoside hydrolase family 15 protein [Actinokineospora xionganensis]MBC6448669.1 glycoside hydrolase family 15 protein [Actinokineospora xionganensis]
MTALGQHSHTAADLVAAGIKVIRDGQHPSGGYVACPTYPTYGFAWLRDGAFCAYAMDLHGEQDSAAAFHRFVATTVLDHEDRFRAAIRREFGSSDHMPPTRYTLAGEIEAEGTADEVWPNFQLDGYGTWLWVLADHTRRGGVLSERMRQAAELVTRYLCAAGHLACYDCWEEFGDLRHTATLGAVIAGLEAFGDEAAARRAAELRKLLYAEHVRDGSFVKHVGSSAVDSSLLWLALPFGVVSVDDPVMARTAARVAAELTGPSGGTRRYLGDTFYGGGEWVLLTAWLGWFHAESGDRESAARLLAWVERQTVESDHLPEQAITDPQAPERVAEWVDRWGPVATPLLWSHAMHLVLVHALGEG